MQTRSQRFRPLGLSIAVIGTAIIYGVLPMYPLLLLLLGWISGRVGANLNGPQTEISILLGIIALVTSVGAWIGRPPWTRLALIIVVWITTIYRVADIVRAYTAPIDPFSGGSFTDLQRLLLCTAPALVMLALYVTWYMNRVPARDFYK